LEKAILKRKSKINQRNWKNKNGEGVVIENGRLRFHNAKRKNIEENPIFLLKLINALQRKPVSELQ